MILTLPFLAHRQYLHGTTLFDALLPQAPPGSAISLKISRMIESDRIDVGAPRASEIACASFSWHGPAGEMGELAVVPLSASSSPRREPYDEALVTDSVRPDVEGRRVSFERPSPFSFVATLIPLNKVLLRRHSPQGRDGQWLFTRIDVETVPERFVPLTLDYDAALARGALVRSRITAGGRPIGSLYFSWSAKGAGR